MDRNDVNTVLVFDVLKTVKAFKLNKKNIFKEMNKMGSLERW